MKPSIKKFESEDSINESQDLNNILHIKEEQIMNDENIIPSENEGTDSQPESSDRVSGEEKLFRCVDMSRSDFIDEDKSLLIQIL